MDINNHPLAYILMDGLNYSLDYQKIKENPQNISKRQPYINQDNWKDIKFPLDKENWKKF